jgi:hypothetical protein
MECTHRDLLSSDRSHAGPKFLPQQYAAYQPLGEFDKMLNQYRQEVAISQSLVALTVPVA